MHGMPALSPQRLGGDARHSKRSSDETFCPGMGCLGLGCLGPWAGGCLGLGCLAWDIWAGRFGVGYLGLGIFGPGTFCPGMFEHIIAFVLPIEHSIAFVLPRERCGLGGPAARRGPQSPEAAYSSPARAPRAAAEARSGPLHVLLLVIALGVCGQVLLVDHLGDILEMLLRQGCEVRVVAC